MIKGMVERLGEMRNGRRERFKKGSREGIEKERKERKEKETFEEEEGLKEIKKQFHMDK